MSDRRFWLAFVAIMSVTAGLRFATLGRWPFASDELGTFSDVRLFRHPPEIIEHPDQSVPRVIPLSMLAFDAGHRLFGRDEFGSRVVPAACGVAAVAITMLGLAGVLSRPIALTLGWWQAVWVEHLFYCQYHRFYALTALFTTAAVVLAAKAVRDGSAWRMAAACGLAGAAVGTHTLAGAIFGALAGGAIAAAVRRPAVVAVVGTVIAAAVAVGVIHPLVGQKTAMPNWTGQTPIRAVFAAVASVGWPACVLASIGAVLLWKRERRQAAFWLAGGLVWAGSAVVLPVVLPFHSAYLFPLSLPVFVFAGVAVCELASAVGRGGVLVWVGLSLLGLPGLVSYHQDGNRHDFRTAAGYVAERIGPNDRVLCNEPEKFNYYAPTLEPRVSDLSRSDSPELEMKRVPPVGRLWVVMSGGRDVFEPGWQGWVSKNCFPETVVRRQRFDYYEFTVGVFVTPSR